MRQWSRTRLSGGIGTALIAVGNRRTWCANSPRRHVGRKRVCPEMREAYDERSARREALGEQDVRGSGRRGK